MSRILFAYSGIVRVFIDYENSDGKPVWSFEEESRTLITNSLDSDINDEMIAILSDLGTPEKEGDYHLWVTGSLFYSYDGFTGEHDVDSELTRVDWNPVYPQTPDVQFTLNLPL